MMPINYPTRSQGWIPALLNDYINEGWVPTSKCHCTTPAVNVSELEKEYKVEVAAPGISKKDFKVVYTPLHGTGASHMVGLLEGCGYNVYPVKEQMVPDGNFTTLKSPNPEESSAFEYAINLGKEIDADILIATDPDADRMGIAAKNKQGEYVLLTGNQTGAILLDYLGKFKKRTKTSMVYNTIVTSNFAKAICEKYNLELVQTLTGFKFIGEQAALIEGTDKEFFFGYEESYGYVIKDFVRDKDSFQATLLLAEVASFYKALGMTLIDVLDEIFDEYMEWAMIEDKHEGTLDTYTKRGRIELQAYDGTNWADAHFYLFHNEGNWTINDANNGVFDTKWEYVKKEGNVLLKKGETYSMLFPYCTGCWTEEGKRPSDFWDYWSGKFLIFESVSAPQTINGKDFLNEEIENNIFTVECASDEVAVTGNSTFAMLETDRSNLFVYDEGEGFYNAECFLPKENDNDIVTIQPTTAFLYGKVPVHPISGMPAKKITRDGKIIYGEKPNQDDNTQDNPEDNSTTGGNVPTVGGGNDLFITAINGGINIAVAEPQNVRVLTATGAIIFNGYITTAADVNLPTQGIYVISGENEVQKIFY